MRKCGNFKQMLKYFYEWLEFDPNIGTAALTNTTPHTCKSTKIFFKQFYTLNMRPTQFLPIGKSGVEGGDKWDQGHIEMLLHPW